MVRTAAEERAHWDATIYRAPFWTEDVWSPPEGWRRDLFLKEHRDIWEQGQRDSLAKIVPHVAAGLRPGGRVLDLGCGVGRVTIPMARLCPQAEIVGIDISPVAIERACDARDEAGVANATFLIGDGRTIPDVGPLDAAYSMLMFQHCEPETVRGYLDGLVGALKDYAPFRFQWTVGETHEPYAHDHPDSIVREWAGLLTLSGGSLEQDEQYPTWRWATLWREVRPLW